MADFLMPSLGADMESATVIQWRVQPGDTVKRGDVVASVETAKGIIDIEIFDAGVIETLVTEPGSEVAVGGVLATFRPEGEMPTPPPDVEPARQAPTAPAEPPERKPAAESPTEKPAAAAPPARRRVSPAARRRALELGLDPNDLAGSGPDGSVTLADVERGRGERDAPPPAETKKPGFADMRSVIGQAMSRSKREIPHYYLATTIDMTRAMRWLEQWNAAHAVTERILYGALLLKAVALALEQVPELNGFWRNERFEPGESVNVGTAIRLRQGGLIAPCVEDAGSKSVPELMDALRSLVARARTGHLRGAELGNGTITVSSLGEGSVETVYPVIYPPQVAIVGFGSIVQRPWCTDGKLIAAPLIAATLAADHRVSDGHRGGQFLAEMDRLLQEPERL